MPVPANGVHPQHMSAPAPSQMQHQDHTSLLYDLSSFDPLQAHALQLTASAGLTNLLQQPPPMGATGGELNGQQSQHLQNSAPHQGLAQHITQLHMPQQGNPQQPTYYYIQPQASTNTSALQPIAPATQQGPNQGSASQPAAQSYFLPATGQGATLGIPQGYQQQILPSNLVAPPTAAPGVMPGLMMSQHLQSMVANATQQPAPLAPAMNGVRKRDEEYGADRQGAKKARELAPSVVSSNTNCFKDLDKPPQEATQAELDRMTPAERRRYERNLREQQRSYKISQQIKELRDVLADSNVPFKPNKYSILLSVVDYIKQLQSRAIMLDSEHQKLITTIRQTNEMVNDGTAPSSADELDTTNCTSDSGSDNEMLFVQGLDYRSLFEQCPAALGIAALDGRILECNPEFQLLLGLAREDLTKQSLFNLVRNHQDIFRAMAEMLKGAEDPGASNAKNRYWSGEVISKRDTKVSG